MAKNLIEKLINEAIETMGTYDMAVNEFFGLRMITIHIERCLEVCRRNSMGRPVLRMIKYWNIIWINDCWKSCATVLRSPLDSDDTIQIQGYRKSTIYAENAL